VNAMPAQEPPEAQTIRSLMHIARILALIFGIIFVIAGLLTFVAAVLFIGFAILAIFLVLWGVIDFMIYLRLREIEGMVNQRQYEAAKSRTLIWMILGFIIGGIIVGILLLVAYLKFDPLISASRQMSGGMPPAYGAPAYTAPAMAPAMTTAPSPTTAAAPAPAPPPPPAAGGAQVPFCGNCGKPTTYVPQYGRYYCYDCKQYV
jgi:hypothetical protein